MFDLSKLSTIKIGLASPETIKSWSYAEKHFGPGKGEVTKSETINYRSQKPEPDGLFCERIFGPFKDYECHCGKFKKVRYAGQVCDKCGVEVTTKAVRRERMGYISLAAPCAHIWYTKGTPSKMALLLGIPPKSLEEVIYFQSHVVLNPGTCKFLKYKDVLDERTSREVFKTILSDFISTGTVTAENSGNDFALCQAYVKRLEDISIPVDFITLSKLITKYTGAEFGWGSASVKRLLQEIDLDKELAELQEELKKYTDPKSQNRIKFLKRLEVVESLKQSDNKPEWMILDVLPVIPPDLRPLLQLEGGRFGSSDLTDLYRNVINRNTRLIKLQRIKAPSVIQVNEMRMIQEAVDALIDNGRRNKPQVGTSGRPLKSLSSGLKGKQGRFRQNLLGKRVDYSGRSVICVGPFLKMDQCGLPRVMAVQLFKPFIVHYLMVKGFASTTKAADSMIARYDDKVFDALEEIVPQHPVLLNRAPTLHRLGIQAFRPVLVDGQAIRLHPLVCPGFNADFDGDQMAIHVPLSRKAQQEAFDLMMSTYNILSPRDASVLAIPVQDVVVGHYYLTSEQTPDDYLKQANTLKKVAEKTVSESERLDAIEQAALFERYATMDGHAFRNFDEVMKALNFKEIQMNTRIAVPAKSLHKVFFPDDAALQAMTDRAYLITTPGKLIFNNMFPHDFPFINDSNKHYPDVFKHADVNWFVPFGQSIKEALAKWKPTKPVAKGQLAAIINQLFLHYGSRRTAILLDRIKDTGYDQCTKFGLTISLDDINTVPGREESIAKGEEVQADIEEKYQDGLLTKEGRHKAILDDWDNVKKDITAKIQSYMTEHPRNPVFMMADSGARGSLNNFVQLIGIRGLMSGPNNTTIEVPVKDTFRQGMNVSEYFIATHGSRKGSTDTALKTADSGYLTRRLVDVSHSVVIRMDDCGVDHGIHVKAVYDNEGKIIITVAERALGRFAANDICDKDGNIICHRNEFIDEKIADAISKAGLESVEIRSLLTCQAEEGVCIKCYGRNMATGEMARIGDTVGIMAAQSIGEPGTQLTMRTFHEGGTAGSDITQGLPRVQELLEVRNPKGQATIAQISGDVVKIYDDVKEKKDGKKNKTGKIHFVIKNDKEEIDQLSATFNPKVLKKFGSDGLYDKTLPVHVEAGEALTTGSTDPKELLADTDPWTTARYLIDEVQKVYNSQSIKISDKHIEVIIRQMISKVLILDGGDTDLIPGIRTDIGTFTAKNQKAFDHGQRPAVGRPMILGVTKAALNTVSFLSSASFQETTRVLTDAALAGKVDSLKGLKENVMIGKLIPAGTGIAPLPEDEDFIAKEEESESDFQTIKSGFTETHYYAEDVRGYGADISNREDPQDEPLPQPDLDMSSDDDANATAASEPKKDEEITLDEGKSE